MKEIYETHDLERVKNLARANDIEYIIIDDGNRNSKEYKLNEELIKNNFEPVYENIEKRTTIYRATEQ